MKGSDNILGSFIDSLSNLPADIYRNCMLMRELDVESLSQSKTVQAKIESYLTENKRENKTETSIMRNMQKTLDLTDEKVQLAQQTYDKVDYCIRRLDTDLRALEQVLEQNQESTETPDSDKTNKSRVFKTKYKGKGKGGRTSTLKGSKASSRSGNVSNRLKHRERREISAVRRRRFDRSRDISNVPASAATPSEMHTGDMPVDPNEPRYCICNRVSFGQMVACDNTECPREWFHFQCVGLESTPKGKWYCPDCAALKEKGLL
eukprot:gb/GECH01004867.1/.p1 GENE.gb/GECH01004867.1/~~gb/GECH01004867.1/.p1  ORF type:complete len:263 (+),score=72.08 gb/GECH01004867.1/:1-789(+)